MLAWKKSIKYLKRSLYKVLKRFIVSLSNYEFFDELEVDFFLMVKTKDYCFNLVVATFYFISDQLSWSLHFKNLICSNSVKIRFSRIQRTMFCNLFVKTFQKILIFNWL